MVPDLLSACNIANVAYNSIVLLFVYLVQNLVVLSILFLEIYG
jgi:hypothetical protein